MSTQQSRPRPRSRPAPGIWTRSIPASASPSVQRRRHLPRHASTSSTQRSSTAASKVSPRSPASESTTRTSPATCRAPDFFDAEQYPELRFVSKSIERDGDEVSIQGDLTIRGITHPVEIAGTVVGPLDRRLRAASGSRFDVETTVNRQDYGHHLEHGAPERRPGARRRRHDHRHPRVGAGVVDEDPRDQRQPPAGVP